MFTATQYTSHHIHEISVTNLCHYTQHNKLHHQSTEYCKLTEIHMRRNQCT